MIRERIRGDIGKPGCSFLRAPQIAASDPNVRTFVEQNVVQQGLPVIVTQLSKGMFIACYHMLKLHV